MTIAAIPHALARLASSGLAPVFRDVLPDERRFVAETTAKVLLPRGFRWNDWEMMALPRIEEIMRTGRTVIAGVDHGGTQVALGFLILEASGSIAMVYVKRSLRGHGIGLALIDSADIKSPIIANHVNLSWERWTKRHGLPWHIAPT